MFVACGARPFIPPVPGIDGKNVVTAEDVLLGQAEVKGEIVIVGSAITGLETTGHPFANDFSTRLVVIHVRGYLAHLILDSGARPRVTYGRDKYVVGASDSAPMRRLPGNVCRAYRGGLASSVNTAPVVRAAN